MEEVRDRSYDTDMVHLIKESICDECALLHFKIQLKDAA